MTAQIHERLIFEGEDLSMAFCPLLPEKHPRIVSRREEMIEKGNTIFLSTACWRGYQGTWEIRDGNFYLVDLQGQFILLEGEPLWAEWFSGTLRVPKGEMLQYVHMGFGTVYEEEIHIKVECGRLAAPPEIVDNRGKPQDRGTLAWENLPGQENTFPGDGTSSKKNWARRLFPWLKL